MGMKSLVIFVVVVAIAVTKAHPAKYVHGSGSSSHSTPSYNCETVYKTVYEKQCETKYVTEYHKECNTVYEEKCENVPKTECHHVPKDECKDVSKQVPKEECRQVPKKVAKEVCSHSSSHKVYRSKRSAEPEPA